ncbi:MAG: hypothetical protein AMXMBFR60_27990 [Chloroflexota bacterium]|nr:hypothetical protein [Anaerolineales bacterium]NUQ60153.1 hypothetical protein [Anaerolineales bacterium]
MTFPEKFLDLFQPETKAFLFLATVNSLRYDNKPWARREDQKRIIFKIKPVSFDEHN